MVIRSWRPARPHAGCPVRGGRGEHRRAPRKGSQDKSRAPSAESEWRRDQPSQLSAWGPGSQHSIAVSRGHFIGPRAQVGGGLARMTGADVVGARARRSRGEPKPSPGLQAPGQLFFSGAFPPAARDDRSVFCLAGQAWPCSGTQAPSEVPPRPPSCPNPDKVLRGAGVAAAAV